MKKRILYIAAIALAALSCTRELFTEILPSNKQVTFTVTWGDSRDTKTAIQPDGTSVWWTTNEQINAFYGTLFSGVFTSTNTEPAAKVQFAGSLNVLAGGIETDGSQSKYWAVYPYDESNTCDGQSVTLTVPSVQPATSGTFTDKFFPAVASSTSLELAFYNVCGGARFSVSQSGITDIIIKSADGTPIAGRVKVGFGDDHKPVILAVENGESLIHLKADDGGFVPGNYYFAAMLPATHAQGILIGFNKPDGTGATMTIDKSLTVHRSLFGKLDNLDDGLTYTYGGGLTLGPQEGDGTEANPYNVAKACAVACALKPGQSIDDVYTKGVVSQINKIDSENEGLATYFIQDPGYDPAVEIWKGNFLAGTSFTSEDQLKVGDEVVIKGSLVLYNNVQPEYAKRSKIVWLNGVKEYDAYPVSQTTLNASLTVENNSHISFNDGIVVAISAMGFVVSNGEHNMHVFDSDYKKVRIGDKVIIDGIKTTYYGIPEMISSTATVISSGNELPRTPVIDISQTAGTYTATEADYLAITGIVSIDGSYIDFLMPGTDIRCYITNKPASFNFSPMNGKLVTMYGYYCFFDPTRKAHAIIISSFEEAEPLPLPEPVDLGLNVKWAPYNLGALSPEQYGYYFAWGETEPKADYVWDTYKLCNGNAHKLTKYCPVDRADYWDGTGTPDGKTVLDPEDDAAHVNWGGKWRMPTDAEFSELRENCTWTWTTQNDVNGCLVTASNGNSIFLPAAGVRYDTNLYDMGSRGYYWSSSLDTDYPGGALDAYFKSGNVLRDGYYRFSGRSVRPVCE